MNSWKGDNIASRSDNADKTNNGQRILQRLQSQESRGILASPGANLVQGTPGENLNWGNEDKLPWLSPCGYSNFDTCNLHFLVLLQENLNQNIQHSFPNIVLRIYETKNDFPFGDLHFDERIKYIREVLFRE